MSSYNNFLKIHFFAVNIPQILNKMGVIFFISTYLLELMFS